MTKRLNKSNLSTSKIDKSDLPVHGVGSSTLENLNPYPLYLEICKSNQWYKIKFINEKALPK